MLNFWNFIDLVLVLASLYCLISVLRPLPPFRSRWIAVFALVGVIFAFGPVDDRIASAEQEAYLADYEARQILKKEDPARFAALVAAEREQAQRAEEDRKKRVAEKIEREAAAGIVLAKMDDTGDFLPNLAKLDRHLTDPMLIDQDGGPLKGEVVRVTYYDPEPLSESALLFEASEAYLEVARYVTKEWPIASGVQFIVKTDEIDQYGHRKPAFAFVLSMPRGELRKINWDTFIGAYLLDLSSVDRKGLGRSIGRSYCDDHSHNASRFCRTVTAR